MWGTSSPDDEFTGDLATRLRLHRSLVVGWFVLWREIYHRAILDFCNTIGTKRTYRHAATMSALEAKPDDICSLRAFPGLDPSATWRPQFCCDAQGHAPYRCGGQPVIRWTR